MIHDPTPRIVKIGDALSQLLNVSLSWDHTATTSNESISSKGHRMNLPRRRFINALFFWQADHCKMSFDKDVDRARQTLRQAEQDK